MFAAEQSPPHRQCLAEHGFGFGQPPLYRIHIRQVLERIGHLDTLVAQQFPAHEESVTAVFFGLFQFGEMHLAKVLQGISEGSEGRRSTLSFLAKPRSSALETLAGYGLHLLVKSEVM